MKRKMLPRPEAAEKCEVVMDSEAAEVAETILREWLVWFGDGMDQDDLGATERAVSAFSEVHQKRQCH